MILDRGAGTGRAAGRAVAASLAAHVGALLLLLSLGALPGGGARLPAVVDVTLEGAGAPAAATPTPVVASVRTGVSTATAAVPGVPPPPALPAVPLPAPPIGSEGLSALPAPSTAPRGNASPGGPPSGGTSPPGVEATSPGTAWERGGSPSVPPSPAAGDGAPAAAGSPAGGGTPSAIGPNSRGVRPPGGGDRGSVIGGRVAEGRGEGLLAFLSRRIEGVLSYPEEARRRSEEGEVLLRIRVGEGGEAREVRVARSSGFRLLDDAARRGVARAVPLPAEAGWIEVPVRFTLTSM